MNVISFRYTPYKKIIVCIQFPKDYPNEALLIELKSKTLSTSLLLKLTDLLEKECRNKLGTAQVNLCFCSNNKHLLISFMALLNIHFLNCRYCQH